MPPRSAPQQEAGYQRWMPGETRTAARARQPRRPRPRAARGARSASRRPAENRIATDRDEVQTPIEIGRRHEEVVCSDALGHRMWLASVAHAVEHDVIAPLL